MTMIINPGSGPIPESTEGLWTNTHERAWQYAEEWRDQMRSKGIDVSLLSVYGTPKDGRWKFTFRHNLTGKIAHLEHHGISNLAVYERALIFEPRVYWNGSSSSNPQHEDFLLPGYHVETRIVKDEEDTP